jgi:hypothetical protein
MPDTRFQYVVSVKSDGSVTIDPSVPEGREAEIEREASAIDIVDSSRKLIADLERSLIFQGISEALLASFPKPEPTVGQRVADALKERTAEEPTE